MVLTFAGAGSEGSGSDLPGPMGTGGWGRGGSGAWTGRSPNALPPAAWGLSLTDAMSLLASRRDSGDACDGPRYSCELLEEAGRALEDPLYKTIYEAQERTAELVLGAEIATSKAALKVSTKLFGRNRGGLLNSNRYFRIGFSAYKGRRIFRIGGKFVEEVTGKPKITLWDAGPL